MSGEMTTPFIASAMTARGYSVLEGTPSVVLGGAADSRLVKSGDLFAAFRGENVDGNEYVDAAVGLGAVAAIAERAPARRNPDCTYVVGDDSRATVADLAKAWLAECDANVIGITGTVGKTTAKELLAAAASCFYETHHSPGNFNSREGLPLALCSLTKKHEISILEMAMDSPGEIAELCDIARPRIGLCCSLCLCPAAEGAC